MHFLGPSISAHGNIDIDLMGIHLKPRCSIKLNPRSLHLDGPGPREDAFPSLLMRPRFESRTP